MTHAWELAAGTWAGCLLLDRVCCPGTCNLQCMPAAVQALLVLQHDHHHHHSSQLLPFVRPEEVPLGRVVRLHPVLLGFEYVIDSVLQRRPPPDGPAARSDCCQRGWIEAWRQDRRAMNYGDGADAETSIW
jgi:hypothetical protein